MLRVRKFPGGGETGVDVCLERAAVSEDALNIFKEILPLNVLGRERAVDGYRVEDYAGIFVILAAENFLEAGKVKISG